MSAAKRQRTCAACGRPIEPDTHVNIEPLIVSRSPLRHVVTHTGCSTFPHIPRKDGPCVPGK